jgi:hypothetical protein
MVSSQRLSLLRSDEVLTQSTELRVRQNDSTNTTSPEPEGHWTLMSPEMAVSVESLDIPGEVTTNPAYPSPVTEITKLSLGGPAPEATETTTQDSVSQSRQSRPIIQPTVISLVVPVTDAGSDQASFITVLPTAHVENSVTYIYVPGTETTSVSRTPKMPHLEKPDSQLDHPSEPTDSPTTQSGDDEVIRETSGSDASTNQPTQAGVVIPIETGSARNGGSAVSQTQNAQASQQGSVTTGGVAGNGGSAGSQTQNVQASQQGSVTTGGVAGNAEASESPTFVIKNTPLVAGGSPITVDGTTYSLASTGSAIAVNGNTVSFTTDSQGQAVPVGPTADASAGGSVDAAATHALGGLSIAPAEATTTGETSQETGSTGDQQSSGSASGSRGASPTSSARNSAGATATTDGSAPSVQSDNAGASNLPWSISAIVGAIGFLAVVV